eukprot:CAMPEP_0168756446 /NCGR_PEP_ID=MMETSP0724-20121128/20618_1 /TAXON_ID=265536 /ORGANISM="Amphiprora sp., Strain CCMP467" /LENGTH=261 /DNA_ID=CAMNT_0008805151 /DNA_START=25 /DNA_END=806 /DNA_ORIENTATION=+
MTAAAAAFVQLPGSLLENSRQNALSTIENDTTDWNGPFSSSSSTENSVFLEVREKLKADLEALAFRTERGFKATDQERTEARHLIFQLSECNPTPEPLSSYYNNDDDSCDHENSNNKYATLQGDWSLIYTDAPDILGLDSNNDSSSSLLQLATLGRIGQQCDPPYIRNVIEWLRPAWADALPLAGTEQSRVVQKVVTQAQALPEAPRRCTLTLVGLEIDTDDDENSNVNNSNKRRSLPETLQQRGLVATLVARAPVKQWRG